MAGRYIKHLEEWYGAPVFEEGQLGEPTAQSKEIWPVAKSVTKALKKISPHDEDTEKSLIVDIDKTMDYEEFFQAYSKSDHRLRRIRKKWRELNDLLDEG